MIVEYSVHPIRYFFYSIHSDLQSLGLTLHNCSIIMRPGMLNAWCTWINKWNVFYALTIAWIIAVEIDS